MTPDLRPGAIVYTYIPTIDPPKKKYSVVAHLDTERDSAALFLIHTELPKFIQQSGVLIKGVTRIDQAAHTFLKYDSWLRFGEVHARSYSELVHEVGSDPECFRGYASDALIKRLLELIPACPELSQKWQVRYCTSLSSVAQPAEAQSAAESR